jgi:dTDP-glucose pyrophosphorylase
MTGWRDTLVSPDQSVLSTIKSIDKSVLQIALVVDSERRLLGSVTDGDIRRAILNGIPMEAAISTVMNQSPYWVSPDYDLKKVKATMTARHYRQVPVLDHDRQVVDLIVIDDLLKSGAKHDNWVVLMAGGQGTRLRPLTENTPKPLIEVGGKPILETILESFVNQGFSKFYISVNYRGEQIKARFGNGAAWNAVIRYLDEQAPLGTAGALSLIKDLPESPLIVMNADLVTDVDFSKMLDFHQDHDSFATMAVREYDIQVQFGVVEIDDGVIRGINEKPVHRFLVNGGIYTLQPESLASIPHDMKMDMPTMFETWIAAGERCVAFPVHEYWLDVGRIEDLTFAEQKAKTTNE